MRKFVTILLIFITLSANLSAQEAAIQKKVWTMQECVAHALANSLPVKRSELALQSSEVDLVQSKMNLLPSANASASYGYNWGRGLDPVTNTFEESIRNNVSSLGASGSLVVFNSFRNQNSIKQYSNAYGASQQNLEKVKNDVTINILSLFVNVIFNKELVENARLQIGSSQQQLERTRKQVAAGALPKVDELNLEAQVASNELNLINQENALTLSLLQLQQAMQIPASEGFDVETPQIAPEDLVLDQTREEIFTIAKASMPEIKSSVLTIESSYYAVKAAKGNLYPRLTLNGSVNTNYSKRSETVFVPDGGVQLTNPIGLVDGTSTLVYGVRPTGTSENSYKFQDQFNDNLYKSLSMSLIIPIFNNNQARASVRRSTIAQQQAKISAKEAENTLRQTIETAYNDAIASSKTYGSSQKQVQAREEAYRITKQRYDVGASNYVDWQVAENSLSQARTDLARAKYNFIFRKKILDFYQGKPIGF